MSWISHQPAQQAQYGSGMKQTQGRSNKVSTLKHSSHSLHKATRRKMLNPSDSAMTWLGFILGKMSPSYALSSPST